ncbi:MAG TPA: hypothetical protein VFQ53_34435 [Kofleriaceae bacterium]|nr:hypothetical protein [Kofleriaceae bacterium]
MKQWRAAHGPDREVVIAQRHRPGEAAQTDFTSTSELAVTIAGQVRRILEALHANHVLVDLGLTKFAAKTIRRSLSHRLAANGVPTGMPAHVGALQSVYR